MEFCGNGYDCKTCCFPYTKKKRRKTVKGMNLEKGCLVQCSSHQSSMGLKHKCDRHLISASAQCRSKDSSMYIFALVFSPAVNGCCQIHYRDVLFQNMPHSIIDA
ncbi:hypothetical protein ES288_D11G156100v1 [Gossypium darwinii]|nr:hypothetical protein ES288_D11G156100v1 [Gossypium darwinii]